MGSGWGSESGSKEREARERESEGRDSRGSVWSRVCKVSLFGSSSRAAVSMKTRPALPLRPAPRSDVRFAIQRGSRAYEKRAKRLATRLRSRGNVPTAMTRAPGERRGMEGGETPHNE